jgi:hypothetical protein
MNSLETNKSIFLSELLPYDTSTKINGSLRTSLKEYSLLLVAMQKTMDALKAGDLEQFDAVVGENACQIRAVKVAMLFTKYLESVESIQMQIEKVQEKIRLLSQSITSLMKKGISFQSLLREEQLEVALTLDECFLIESFLLSCAKTVKPSKPSSPLCRNDAADPKKLKQFETDVSVSFTDSLVKKTRQLLSTASVSFVRSQAQLLNDEQLMRMSSEDFTIKYNSWPCIPMFWTYKTLLLASQKNGVPLIIYAKFLAKNSEYAVVSEECIFFKPDIEIGGNTYEASTPFPKDLNRAAIVVQGVVCGDLLPSRKQWKTTLASPIEVVLAGAADHRQYPDSKEDSRIEILDNEEFEGYRKMSRKDGYALENPSVFFIQHVYPSTVCKISLCWQKTKLAARLLQAFLPERSIGEWPQRAVTKIMSYIED